MNKHVNNYETIMTGMSQDHAINQLLWFCPCNMHTGIRHIMDRQTCAHSICDAAATLREWA